MTLKEYVFLHKKSEEYEYLEDIERIIKVMKTIDVEMSKQEANYIWSCYSESLFAGWIKLPKSEEVLIEKILETASDLYTKAGE